MRIGIRKLVAWAPGLDTEDAWQAWSQSVPMVSEQAKPPCKAVKPIVRRRLTQWGKMALQTACECAEGIQENSPMVFASRHGDTHRTLKLLQDLAKKEALSPTAFSLSVHNSSAGIFSMTQNLFGPALALAAGKESLGQALVESYALLENGHDEVLFTFVDEPLADFYQPDADEHDMPFAFSMLLTREATQVLQVDYRKSEQFEDLAASRARLSMALQFLRFWFAGSKQSHYEGSRLNWSFELI